MSNLALRRRMSRSRRSFPRQERGKYRKLQNAKWRHPTGNRSKWRKKIGSFNIVSKGFMGPKDVRGFHPIGMAEVLVSSLKELDGLKDHVVRIASSVGIRKKIEISKKAESQKLIVVNAPKKEARSK